MSDFFRNGSAPTNGREFRGSVAAAALLLAAGCSGGINHPVTTHPRAATDESRGTLEGVSEFSWATYEALGDAAVSFPMEIPEGVQCAFKLSLGGFASSEGPLFWIVMRLDHLLYSTALSFHSNDYVGVGSTLVWGTDPSEIHPTYKFTASGIPLPGRNVEVIVMGKGIQDVSASLEEAFGVNDPDGGKSLNFAVACDGEIDVIDARIGTATLRGSRDLDGVNVDYSVWGLSAAGVPIMATTYANVFGSTESQLESPYSGAIMMANQLVGRMSLTHPGGEDSWLLSGQRMLEEFSSGPGRYEFDMTRISVGAPYGNPEAEQNEEPIFYPFWLAAFYDLAQPIDLGEVGGNR